MDGSKLVVSQREHTTFHYLSVAECLRHNGYRHYCNGMKYLEQGLPAYARGCFTKAQRNYDKANSIDFMPGMFNELANRVAESLLNHG